MILVFGSSLYQNDPQNSVLENALKTSSKEFLFINPLCLKDLTKLELVMDENGTKLLSEGRDFSPSSLYFSRLWRSDCLIDLPDKCLYPTFLRQKIEAFLREISDCFRDRMSFPGTLDRIQFAESKIAIYKIAKFCGLQVPRLTIDSFSNLASRNLYRKSLGFPFSVSLSAEEKQEVALTLTNGLDTKEADLLNLPWQWQTYTKPTSHIRCAVVGKKIWAYALDDSQLNGMSLREANESGEELRWNKINLPPKIQTSILSLLDRLDLKYSAPEFLLDSGGQYIFIDLNPCGDWFGFSNEADADEIATEIVKKL